MNNRKRGEIKKVKNWLLQYTELKREVERETEQALFWRDKALTLSTPNLDNFGIRSTNKKDTADYIITFIDLANHCKELAEQAQIKKEEIRQAIDRVTRRDAREVLKLRYIDELNFSKIAEEMHYSIDWIYRLHRMALKEILETKSVQ